MVRDDSIVGGKVGNGARGGGEGRERKERGRSVETAARWKTSFRGGGENTEEPGPSSFYYYGFLIHLDYEKQSNFHAFS